MGIWPTNVSRARHVIGLEHRNQSGHALAEAAHDWRDLTVLY